MITKSKNRKAYRRLRIKHRIRKTVAGTQDRPRMSVYRSNKEIYVQLIDDTNHVSVLQVSSKTQDIRDEKGTKTEIASLVGKLLAEKALEKNISEVVFDRNGYLYHGRVKALAEAARQAGLIF